MKFQAGQRVVIANPIGNPWLKGTKATVKSGVDKFKTHGGLWVTGYHIEIDGYAGVPFVAVETELESAVVMAARESVAEQVTA